MNAAVARWGFYDPVSGALSQSVVVGTRAFAAAACPPGMDVAEGVFDPQAQRVDLKTGKVVDWQPPAPPADEWRTWAWSTEERRWQPQPTDKARRRDTRRALAAQIEAAERGTLRALREMAIDPTNTAADARLAEIERRIRALRQQMPPE